MKKIRSKKGMTLSETLIAVLLMSLVTLAITAGVTAGMRVYNRIKVKSEAQTLLSTNVAALSEYFENQYVISNADSSDTADIRSFSEESNTVLHIYNNGNKGIYVAYLDGNTTNQDDDKKADENVEEQPLISDKSNTSGLYAKLSDVSTDGKITTFTVKVYDRNDKVAEKAENVKVRTMVQYPLDTVQDTDSQ